MRSPLGAAVLLLSLLAFVTLLWVWQFSGEEVIERPGGGAPSAPRSSGPAAPAAALAGDSALPPGTVALRSLAPAGEAAGRLADAPTAWLRVRDHASGQAIVGAGVRRLQGGTEIAFTDAQGLVGVPLPQPEQLAVVQDGYLLRLVPTRPGTTEAEPQAVQLVRDTWSWRRRFHFVSADGSTVAQAFVRLRPQIATAPTKSPVPAADAVAARAWAEHAMLAGRPVCADIAVQLGTWSEDRSHRLADGQEVRFVAAGEFAIEAASTTGLVGSGTLRVDGDPTRGAETVTVTLQPGAFLDGVVIDVGSGAPLAGATVTLQGGEPLGLLATTVADGAFILGPLAPGQCTLEVRHGDFDPLAFGPVNVPGETVRVPVRRLPTTSLRGRVRARPGLTPLPGASVVWQRTAGSPVTATTDATGAFTLAANGEVDARVTVQAAGYISLVELVAVGAPFADYDLWSADRGQRVHTGVSALLEGVVLGRDGKPAVGASVRWTPRQRTPPALVPGRRVLEGAVLDLPFVTTTGADGAFALETTHFGSGTLIVDSEASAAITVEAIAGQTRSDLRLQR